MKTHGYETRSNKARLDLIKDKAEQEAEVTSISIPGKNEPLLFTGFLASDRFRKLLEDGLAGNEGIPEPRDGRKQSASRKARKARR